MALDFHKSCLIKKYFENNSINRIRNNPKLYVLKLANQVGFK